MRELAVDSDKCDSCGICVLECPARIIELTEPEAAASWVDGAAEICINCGHCVAVCPLAAIGLDTMTPDQCTRVSKELLPTAEQAEHFLRSRRSIRAYRDKPVPHETLARLIDIARYAASGHNSQPLHWLVIEDTAEVRRLAGLVIDWMRTTIREMPQMAEMLLLDRLVTAWDRGEERVMRGAPHAIIAHAPTSDPFALPAAPIALTYVELAAYSMGLGACWAGYLQMVATFHPPMLEEMRLPEGHASLGALMIGYPSYSYARIPLRNEARIIWR